MLRTLLAPNPSHMTLDGTRTYIIGRREVAVIDPGPAIESHLSAIADAVGDGARVSILLTHAHPDHDEAVGPLSEMLGAPVFSHANGSKSASVQTDGGELRALHTPGHTPDHLSFWWTSERAMFCGDLMMGGLDTALVARPEGDLERYLESLRKLQSYGPRVIYPAHGPPFADPAAALDQYFRHRQLRVEQVIAGLDEGSRTEEQITEAVYGGQIPHELAPYARAAVGAYVDYLAQRGKIRHTARGWERMT